MGAMLQNTSSAPCDSCNAASFGEVMKCENGSICPYTFRSGSLDGFHELVIPREIRAALGTMIGILILILFIFSCVIPTSNFSAVSGILIALLIAIPIISSQFDFARYKMLINERTGEIWERDFLYGIPMQTVVHRPVTELNFTASELPEAPFSALALHIHSDGKVESVGRVEDAVTILQLALAGLYYWGYIRFVRMQQRTGILWMNPGSSRRIVTQVGLSMTMPDALPRGVVERELFKVLRNAGRPIDYYELSRSMFERDIESPAGEIIDQAISSARYERLIRESSKPSGFMRFAQVRYYIEPNLLMDYKQQKALANHAWAQIFDQEKDMVREMGEQIKRALASRQDSGY
jgi:hypothetical protein